MVGMATRETFIYQAGRHNRSQAAMEEAIRARRDVLMTIGIGDVLKEAPPIYAWIKGWTSITLSTKPPEGRNTANRHQHLIFIVLLFNSTEKCIQQVCSDLTLQFSR